VTLLPVPVLGCLVKTCSGNVDLCEVVHILRGIVHARVQYRKNALSRKLCYYMIVLTEQSLWVEVKLFREDLGKVWSHRHSTKPDAY
jgi:hypothetical protein